MLRPCVAFEKPSIQRFFPAKAGPTVYWIFTDHQRTTLLYVGATTDPRARLLAHLRNPEMVSGVTVEVAGYRTTTAMARAEANAIATLDPIMLSGPARRHSTWKAQNRRLVNREDVL